MVKQISVFLENKSGRLSEVAAILAEKSIDISASCIADTTDFGILRLIVDKPQEAEEALREKGFAVKCTDVIAIAIDDKPGGLAKALSALDSGVGIEYLYAFAGKQQSNAKLIIRVEQPDKAIDAFNSAGITVLKAQEVCSL